MKFHVYSLTKRLRQTTIIFYLLLIALPLITLILVSFEPVTTENSTKQNAWAGITWVLVSPDINANSIFDVNKVLILFGAIRVAIKVVGLTLILSLPLVWLFLMVERQYRTPLLLLFSLPIWVSPFIKTIAWSHLINWVPNTWLNDEHKLVFVIAANMLPIMTLIMVTSVEQISRAMLDAAQDLYMRRFRIFQLFMMPRLLTGGLVGSILTFIPSLMAFYEPLIMASPETTDLGIWIKKLSQNQFQLPIAAAYSSLIILITLAVCHLSIVHKMRKSLL